MEKGWKKYGAHTIGFSYANNKTLPSIAPTMYKRSLDLNLKPKTIKLILRRKPFLDVTPKA